MGDQRRQFSGVGHLREPIPEPILTRTSPSAQAGGAPHLQPIQAHEYAFLVGRCIDAVTLAQAGAQAHACGVDIHEILLATGVVSGEDYAAALALALGIPLAGWDAQLDIGPAPEDPDTDAAWLRWGGPGEQVWRVLAADEAAPPTKPQSAAAPQRKSLIDS